MDITWLGNACFRLRSRDATLVTDPYDDSAGQLPRGLTADIVTVSHAHPAHDHVAGLTRVGRRVGGPGEYEIANVFITGVATSHDTAAGADRGRNTVYLVQMDGVRVCHLGDLGHALTSEQAEELSNVEVLLIPVGGGTTIEATAAAEVVSLLEPRVVVPMHFRSDRRPELETVDRFLKEMGVEGAAPQARLTVTHASLPQATTVVLLTPSA